MITFIIPAYQAEKTLTRTVESILRQTDDRWKIILINDGSTDDTENICIRCRDLNPDKISYIYQENSGQGKARNVGIELVTTDYLSFLDSDDWLMPDYVETVGRFLKRERPEMILTLPVIWHEGSRITRDWYDKEVFESVFPKDGVIICPGDYPECYTMEVNACRKVLRTDYVQRIGFRFPEGIKWEDIYPHFYLLSNCESCMGIKSVGFYYRVGSLDQTTASRGKERLDILPIFAGLLDYVTDNKKEELQFPVMRLFVRFSIWCIKMTEGDVRIQLVRGLSSFYREIPKSFYKALKKGSRESYSRADALQYRLFLTAIRSGLFRWVFYDYLYEDAAEKIVKKVLRAKERVA